MKITTRMLGAAFLAAGFAGSAFAQGTGGSHAGHSMANDPDATHRGEMVKMIEDMMPKKNDAPSTAEFKKADMKMMHDMHVPYTGNADVDYRTHMIPHHKGAVEMSKVVLKHAKDPATKAMAEKIIADQEKEIAEMEDWLKKNRK
ncbi:CopM family metallochaperone [Methylobacterium iners]|uniref:DUF305 domain-containing protein n=1 Tax=Methylobacterium iners TaxID=418707 RepID=A0ABQ4RUU1_9HYPH|nr:DUF305 domain-containing protein [Methylobacterium iners]GJD94479.1 hypothetical protein OCOJLMKI_1681 [Methylobacterium iners]